MTAQIEIALKLISEKSDILNQIMSDILYDVQKQAADTNEEI